MLSFLRRWKLRRRQSQCSHDWGFLQWDAARLCHHRTCKLCGLTAHGMFRDGRLVPPDDDHHTFLPNGRTVREEIIEGERQLGRLGDRA